MSRRRNCAQALRHELRDLRRTHRRVLGSLLLLWALGSGVAAATLAMGSWQDIEAHHRQDFQTALGLLELRANQHRVTALDWGHWDTMEAFAAGHDPAFVSRELEPSSIVTDGQELLAVNRQGRTLINTSDGDLAGLQPCLRERLKRLQLLSRDQNGLPAFGFLCRAGAAVVIGAATTIERSRGGGPPQGWLLHFSRIERPSYNPAVNAAFRRISTAVREYPAGKPPPDASPIPLLGGLVAPERSYGVAPGIHAQAQLVQSVRDSLLPWLSLNLLVGAAGGVTLVGRRRLRLNQRRLERRTLRRRRWRHQANREAPFSRADLLATIRRGSDQPGDRWIVALKVTVNTFDSRFSHREAAETLTLRTLSELLTAPPCASQVAWGEERCLFGVFHPASPANPEAELDRLRQLMARLQLQLAGSMKLAVRGLLTPLDTEDAARQLSDLALLIGTGRGARQLEFLAGGVVRRAAEVREQLRLDFDVNRLVDGLEKLHYHLDPVMRLEGDQRSLAYSEMLFRPPTDGERSTSVQEVILSLERSGTVHQLDQRMLHQAIGLLQQAHHGAHPLGVNISAGTLGSEQHFSELLALLQSLPAIQRSQLVLEVTETAIVEQPDLWHSRLHQLHQLGIPIAIDDFGVGYASISYLFRFQPEYLKLDMSYTQRPGDTNVDGLVEFLLHYSRHNHCLLIAEGVETEEQLSHWQAKGVTHFQGYLFSRRPQP